MFGDSISIQQALAITVICMVIVFAVLIVLSLILDNFKYISIKENENKNVTKQKAEGNSTKDSSCKGEVLSDLESEDDLIAAMAASIAASAENRKSKIRIKSIKRIK